MTQDAVRRLKVPFQEALVFPTSLHFFGAGSCRALAAWPGFRWRPACSDAGNDGRAAIAGWRGVALQEQKKPQGFVLCLGALKCIVMRDSACRMEELETQVQVDEDVGDQQIGDEWRQGNAGQDNDRRLHDAVGHSHRPARNADRNEQRDCENGGESGGQRFVEEDAAEMLSQQPPPFA